MKEPQLSQFSTRDKILLASRQLFAERGFKGTTTAAIAQRAGVNEALIYRHFPAKTDLYTAILRAKMEDEALVKLMQTSDCLCLPVEEALRLVGRRFLDSHDPAFLRLYYHSALEGHALASQFYDQFVSRFSQGVERLLHKGITEGIFREIDTAIAAQAFTGMFRAYALSAELFPNQALIRPNEEVVATFCDLFLCGLRPQGGE